MSKRNQLSLLLVLFLSLGHPTDAGTTNVERGRMEDILNVVSKDVQKNFYDPTLKGLDWIALTEQARQRIRSADHVGAMIGAISALLYQLRDSHTVFIPPGRTVHAIYGFKAQPFADEVLVYELEKGGPAAKAGLQLGDRIIGVDNLNAARPTFFDMMRYLSVLDPRMELDVEIANGTSSRVLKIPSTLEPHPKRLFLDYNEIMRAIDSEKHFYSFKDYDNGVVYLKLQTFLVPTVEMGAMANKARNAKAVVLDLRGNGGGALDAMTDLLGRFMREPFEMAKAVSREKSEPIRVKPVSPLISSPVFVLIDSASASGSEMFARSMQRHKRAVVIGDKSSGRVNRARVFWEEIGAYDRVAFGTEIAVSRVIMENNEELENRGVTPDEFCIPTPADLHAEKDPCLERALSLARSATAVSQATTGKLK